MAWRLFLSSSRNHVNKYHNIKTMTQGQYQFSYDLYDSAEALTEADRQLLQSAQDATAYAYAPYSNFHVGAAALLHNGQVETGTNQENASYPAGICAERVLLSAISSHHHGAVVDTMAITYDNQTGESSKPISPCGICRQSLLEQEEKQGKPMRLILSGKGGQVLVIYGAAALLPFAFRKGDLLG